MIQIFLCICAVFTLIGAGSAYAQALPPNQLPMYGGVKKTDEMKKADAALIAAIEKEGLSKEEGARRIVRAAWGYFAKRDLATAMMRFNQAWLLDGESGDPYHGFALVSSIRGAAPADVETLFRTAISKNKVAVNAFVDYGRFLWLQKRLDESMAQLREALARSNTAFNARSNMAFVYYMKGDVANACEWARAARENKDQLEPGFLEDMCSKAGKG